MKIHGTAKGGALSTKDFGVAFGGAAVAAGCDTFPDSLTTSANGTNVNSTSINTSIPKFGAGCLSFDGSSDQAIHINGIASNSAFSTNQGTMSCWIMVNDPTVTDKVCICWGDTSADSFLQVVVEQSGGSNLLQFFCEIGGAAQWEGRSASPVMSDGEWVNLIITQNQTTVEAYVNNAAVTWNVRGTGKDSWVTSDMNVFRLGCANFNGSGDTRHFEGFIDDFAVFDTVITSDQRAFLQTNPVSSLADCSGIKAYYNCNQFDNSTLTNNAVPTS